MFPGPCQASSSPVWQSLGCHRVEFHRQICPKPTQLGLFGQHRPNFGSLRAELVDIDQRSVNLDQILVASGTKWSRAAQISVELAGNWAIFCRPWPHCRNLANIDRFKAELGRFRPTLARSRRPGPNAQCNALGLPWRRNETTMNQPKSVLVFPDFAVAGPSQGRHMRRVLIPAAVEAGRTPSWPEIWWTCGAAACPEFGVCGGQVGARFDAGWPHAILPTASLLRTKCLSKVRLTTSLWVQCWSPMSGLACPAYSWPSWTTVGAYDLLCGALASYHWYLLPARYEPYDWLTTRLLLASSWLVASPQVASSWHTMTYDAARFGLRTMSLMLSYDWRTMIDLPWAFGEP